MNLAKYALPAHKEMLATLIIKAGKVKAAQKAIVANGTHILVDGEFGPQTATAIKHSRMTPILAHMHDLEHGYTAPKDGKLPGWVRAALGEIGVREIHGSKHNPRVITYMNATKWGKWVHDDETPWCAGFIGWCMVQAGLPEMIPDYSLGAKSWLHAGVSAHKPVFGAIAVKSRKGGGHVGIVVGQSRGGKWLYILGGNQGDEVSVRKYRTRLFIDFRIPKGYKPTRKLTVWNGRAALAGKEA